MRIEAFKLNSGEEIMADIATEGPDFYELKKIRQIGLMQVPGPGGEKDIRLVPQFVPWVLTNPSGDARLTKHSITLHITDIPKALENLYLSETTGLDLSGTK